MAKLNWYSRFSTKYIYVVSIPSVKVKGKGRGWEANEIRGSEVEGKLRWMKKSEFKFTSSTHRKT